MFEPFGKHENRESFEEDLLANLDSLYNFAYRLTRNREEAEDLVQEAAVRGYQNYHRFVQGTNFRAWIFTILRNIFINDYRRKIREPVKVNYEEAEDFVDLPEISGAHEELFGEATQRCLDQLPEELRSVLILFYVEELSYKEIAKVMECPIGTVMSRLYMARQLMKKKMLWLTKEEQKDELH